MDAKQARAAADEAKRRWWQANTRSETKRTRQEWEAAEKRAQDAEKAEATA